MATLSITKKHHLTHAKAKEAAHKVAEDLRERFDLEYHWHGDRCDFSRPGLAGELHIGKDSVRLDAKFGFLLALLKPAIEKEVHKEFDKLFRKPRS